MSTFTKTAGNSITGTSGSDLILVANVTDIVGGLIDGAGGLDELRYTGSSGETLVLPGDLTSVETVVVGTGSESSADVTGTSAESVDGSALTLAISITGNAGANALSGGSGNDTLDGGAGNDTLEGGAGDDTYVLDGAGDLVTEAADAGIDTVRASFSYTLGADLEHLLLTGNGNASGTGNALANALTGNTGDNTLDGGAGADTMQGGLGVDTYIVDNAGDVVYEAVGTRASTDGSGAQANNYSLNAALSADGRYVVFESYASNLVAGDTNSTRDIFVKDLQTGAVTRVSTDGVGAQTNSDSFNAALSADGRYVVFQSYASNLVAGDTNGTYDIFVKDLQTGAVTRASTDASGAQSNRESYNATLSADGRYVVFESYASNLVAGDTNNTIDIFVKDLQTGAVTRASTDASGAQGNSQSGNAALSADGRYVAFQSYASNLVAGDTNGILDIFVKDLQTGAVTRVTIDNPSGLERKETGSGAALSADGRYVAFQSNAANIVAGDTNGTYDIFVKDLQTGAVTRASTDGSGAQANNYSLNAALSADGRYVVFESYASNLVAGDTNGTSDIFVKDLQTGAIARVSTDANGLQSNNYSYGAALSADGSFVVFDSDASNLVAGDTNGQRDIFVVPTGLSVGAGDVIQASVSYTSAPGIEQLVLTGTANLNGTGHAGAERITGNAGRNALLGLAGNDTLEGGAGVDQLSGGEGDDSLLGGLGNDNLAGDAGNDTLDGGAGNDMLAGGVGDDTYVVDSSRDVVRESTGQGIDTVLSGVSYTLAWSEVENVTLTGTANRNATGNNYNNVLSGNAGANRLDGSRGNDSLSGGAGNDTLIGGTGFDTVNGGTGRDSMVGGAGGDIYYVDDAGDVISETGPASDYESVYASVTWSLGANLEQLLLTGSGNVNATGNALDNYLAGNAGNNVLTGGTGVDDMLGGAGDDTYVVDSVEDSVTEYAGQGTDTLVIAYANATPDAQPTGLPGEFENITVTGTGLYDLIGSEASNVLTGNGSANALFGFEANDTLSGGAGNDYLDGGEGNDSLDGGLGIDTMEGGLGDDTYVLDVAGDVTTEFEDEGNDTVVSSVNVSLLLAKFDHIENATLGGTAASAIGDEGTNALTGNASANTLDGGAGADTLAGGGGADVYKVDDGGDIVTEGAVVGIDRVDATVSHTLAANVENLTLLGATGLAGTGNAAVNILVGTAAADTLAGGLGNDTLTGGLGADRFVFDSAPGTANQDRVSDFSAAGGDRIQFDDDIFAALGAPGSLAAAAFRSGAGILMAGDADDRIILNTTTGAFYYDADGAGGTAAVQVGVIVGVAGVTAASFEVVA